MSATTENLILLPAMVAAADLSAHQYKPVSFATSGAYGVIAATNSTQPVGLLANRPTTGKAAEVAGPGSYAKCRAGSGGMTAGAFVAWNGTIATTGKVLGVALNAAAEGALFTVFVMPMQIPA